MIVFQYVVYSILSLCILYIVLLSYSFYNLFNKQIEHKESVALSKLRAYISDIDRIIK